jgi:hypothetical protein
MFLKANRDKKIIAYKLLNDALFVGLIFFLVAIIGEGVLPGIISSHVGLYKIIIALLLVVSLINLLALDLQITVVKRPNKKTVIAVLVVLGLLLLNSIFRQSVFFGGSIILLTAITTYFLYRVIFVEEK